MKFVVHTKHIYLSLDPEVKDTHLPFTGLIIHFIYSISVLTVILLLLFFQVNFFFFLLTAFTPFWTTKNSFYPVFTFSLKTVCDFTLAINVSRFKTQMGYSGRTYALKLDLNLRS